MKDEEILPSQANSNAGMDELCSTSFRKCHYSFMAMYYVQYFGAFWAGVIDDHSQTHWFLAGLWWTFGGSLGT